MTLAPILLYPGGRLNVPGPCVFHRGEIPGDEDVRIHWVMHLLVDTHSLSVDAGAGLIGNLIAESGLLPNRIEGSSAANPMRAPDFNGVQRDFSPEDVMNRNVATSAGPQLPGIGLAQWTTTSRRNGLFAYQFNGEHLGTAILSDIEAQVDYLVHELSRSYTNVDTVLRGVGVGVDDACDEVAYRFEVPGVVLDGQGNLLPRENSHVQALFATRRLLAQRALAVYRSFHP